MLPITLVSYDYTGAGMMVRKDYFEPEVELTYLDGSDDYVGFDRFGRVVDHRWQNYNSSVDLDRTQHGYDRASNRLWRKQTVQATGHDELYTYDSLHRLANVERGTLNGGRDTIASLAFEQDWGLDLLGNWDAFKQDDDGDATWELDQSRTHNDANEIETITGGSWPNPSHDAAGNMTGIPKPNVPSESFSATYNAWNKLVKLTDDADNDAVVAEYEWDGLGRRIVALNYDSGVLDETRHFYYRDHSIIEERVDGTASGDLDLQYIWGLQYVDEFILRDRDTTGNGTTDERLYALQDANYRVIAIVSTAGAVQERYSYSPYGQRTVLNANWSLHSDAPNGSFRFRIGHQGLANDDVTGLIHSRRRVLHPGLGRFMQRDPLEYIDGSNVYRYLNSAPWGSVDPTGTELIKVSGVRSGQLHVDCGETSSAAWMFELQLQGGAPCDGYLVQMVDLYCDVRDCADGECPTEAPDSPTLRFWEAWFVEEGETRVDQQHRQNWTDKSGATVYEGKCGVRNAIGTIRFFCKSDTGDLGEIGRDGEDGWEVNQIWNGGTNCESTSGPLPAFTDGTGTPEAPTWWDDPDKNALPGAPEASRERTLTYNCCDCSSSRFVNADADPLP